jgi:hypothetical protein
VNLQSIAAIERERGAEIAKRAGGRGVRDL